MARRALARVHAGAIERNCALLARTAAPAALCAVVKADGYGHGAVTAGRAALAGGATWLAVVSAEEAVALRGAGLDGRLLIMGALSEEELPAALGTGADMVAWGPDWVAALPAGTRVHVKLDTGMGRLGTRSPDIAWATVEAAEAAGCVVAGVMTHFATADDDVAFAREQLDAFLPFAARVKERFPDALAHAANSAGTLALPAARLDLVRCGIAIYGLDPFHADAGEHGLEPALRLISYVAAVKALAPGQSVGYGRRFVASEPTRIATLPIGYGDGYRRGLTDGAEVVIRGRRFPLVGTVSMDNVTVDVGDAEVEVGDEAVLIGDGITAEDLARRLGTINYEIACGISARVPRVPA